MQRLDVDLEKCYENDLDWTLLPQNLRKVSTLLFRNLTLFSQGHPTTVFSKISVWRRRLKISGWTFHSCTIFEASLINSLRFSEVWLFIFYYTLRLIHFLITQRTAHSSVLKLPNRKWNSWQNFLILKLPINVGIPGVNSKKTTFSPRPRPLQSLLMFDGAFVKKTWELVDVWRYICEQKLWNFSKSK